jgi:hypothetical protein
LLGSVPPQKRHQQDGHKPDTLDRFVGHIGDAVDWRRKKPAEQSLPTLIVTPPTSIAFSGPPGGPFSSSLIE